MSPSMILKPLGLWTVAALTVTSLVSATSAPAASAATPARVTASSSTSGTAIPPIRCILGSCNKVIVPARGNSNGVWVVKNWVWRASSGVFLTSVLANKVGANNKTFVSRGHASNERYPDVAGIIAPNNTQCRIMVRPRAKRLWKGLDGSWYTFKPAFRVTPGRARILPYRGWEYVVSVTGRC